MNVRTARRFLGAATVAAVLAVGASAVPAGASARAVSAADCEALVDLGGYLSATASPGNADGSVFGQQAAEIAEGLKATAPDIANKKLRKAVRLLSDFYDDLSEADGATAAAKITVSQGRAFVKAARIFANASFSCI